MGSVHARPQASAATGYGGLLFSKLNSNLRYKLLWTEASGALGDLGTFIPIVIALTLVNGLDLGTTLIFTGLYNIITGLIFGVPMPVQPMKSIAAVAISQGDPLSVPQIMAAGITTAAVLLFLGITRLMGFVHRYMPLPVVRGIQLSQGLSFAITAVKYVMKEQNFSKDKATGNRPWLGLDGLLLALVSFGFIALVTGSGDGLMRTHCASENQQIQTSDHEEQATKGKGELGEPHAIAGPPNNDQNCRSWKKRLESIPTAIMVFVLGLVLTFIRKPSIGGGLRLGPSKPQLVHISKHDWKVGFIRAAVPQIPLSILNSVIAVCKLSSDLYPEKTTVTPIAVSTSVGLMNLVGCWFGALPVCHGAGGLAGQWKFGARSGMAVVMLGVAKLLIGFLVGSSVVKILSGYPVGLLGVLLFWAGLELAMACRDQTSRGDSMVVLTSAAISLASSNAAIGFVLSLVLYILLNVDLILPCIWKTTCKWLPCKPPSSSS